MNLMSKMRDEDFFTPAEKSVVDYVLNNPTAILKMSSRDLGKLTYTSASTVGRICNKLDLEGFTEFKLKLAVELNTYQHKNIDFNPVFPMKKDDSIKDVINKITHISNNAIKETAMLIEEETLIKVVNMLEKAKKIDLYGTGASRNIANDVMYKFLRIGKPTTAFNENDLQVVNAVVSDESHVAILISYSGRTDDILEIAHILKQNNIPTISITGTQSNPLLKLTDVHLYVAAYETEIRLTAMASRTAMLYLFDIIFALYCIKDYNYSEQMIKKTYINNK